MRDYAWRSFEFISSCKTNLLNSADSVAKKVVRVNSSMGRRPAAGRKLKWSQWIEKLTTRCWWWILWLRCDSGDTVRWCDAFWTWASKTLAAKISNTHKWPDNDVNHQLVTHFYPNKYRIKRQKLVKRWTYHSVLTFQFLSYFDPHHGLVVVQPVKLFSDISSQKEKSLERK